MNATNKKHVDSCEFRNFTKFYYNHNITSASADRFTLKKNFNFAVLALLLILIAAQILISNSNRS